MTSRNSSQSPPHVPLDVTPTSRLSRNIPPSSPYLHLSESGVLHQIDTSTRTPIFDQINIPRYLNSTFEIENVIIFQLLSFTNTSSIRPSPYWCYHQYSS